VVIETPRLRLRRWRESDREAFARLHADTEVMRHLGGPVDRGTSDARLCWHTPRPTTTGRGQ
jgi:RimJ/RimL family protein N-acetyltransferase